MVFVMKKILVTVLMAAAALTAGCRRSEPRTVILISLDTLRQDHLGCYGYPRETSPNLDRFAADEAVLFNAAYVQAPYTLTSHMSMLTGLYPEAHGVLESMIPTPEGRGVPARLPDDVATLSECLKNGGFFTSAFTDGGLMNRKHGHDQGFDEYRDERKPSHAENGFRKFHEPLHAWIDAHVEEDFFLFIHTFDTHAPYDPPEPYRSLFEGHDPARELPESSLAYAAMLGVHHTQDLFQFDGLPEIVDRYDGSIAFVDHEVGELFDLLKRLDRWTDALIVVTSDHGEQFMENDLMIGHGVCMTNEVMLVPLLMKLPGSKHAGKRVEHVVESVDIMPTVLEALGLPVPQQVQGQNLLAGLDGRGWAKDHAYGTSPHTGGNHFLLRDRIKFIEGVRSPPDRRPEASVQPMAPPFTHPPKTPYQVDRKTNTMLYYDFDVDPLGVSELLRRGDRAYHLASYPFEWKSEAVDDDGLLLKFKEAAREIAAASRELHGAFREVEATELLTAEEVRQLEALGYGGMIGGTRTEGAALPKGSRQLVRAEPVVDRSLLHSGDRFLWRCMRAEKSGTSLILSAEFEADLERSRADYEAFRIAHPGKEHWVKWRLQLLDWIMETAGKEVK